MTTGRLVESPRCLDIGLSSPGEVTDESDKFPLAVHFGLFEDVGEMRAHRRATEVQGTGDLVKIETAGEQCSDLRFSGREPESFCGSASVNRDRRIQLLDEDCDLCQAASSPH